MSCTKTKNRTRKKEKLLKKKPTIAVLKFTRQKPNKKQKTPGEPIYQAIQLSFTITTAQLKFIAVVALHTNATMN